MPVALPIGGLFFAVLAFCLAVALTVLWVQILRGPLVKMAGVSIAHFHPLGFLASVVKNVDNWLDSAEKGSERAVVWCLHGIMAAWSTSAKLTADLAQATWEGLEWWKRHTTRHVGAQTGQSISPRLKTLERQYKGIDGRLDRVEHWERTHGSVGAAKSTPLGANISGEVKTLRREYRGIDQRLDRLEHAQTHTGTKAKPGEAAKPAAVPRVVPKSKGASRHWTDVLTKASAAALVTYALARWGASWIKCGNWKRIGQRLCNYPTRWIDALLGGLAILYVSQGLIPLAHDAQNVIGSLASHVQRFLQVDSIGAGYDRRLGDFGPSPDA